MDNGKLTDAEIAALNITAAYAARQDASIRSIISLYSEILKAIQINHKAFEKIQENKD